MASMRSIAAAAVRLDSGVRRARFRLRQALRGAARQAIVAYRGYGTSARLHISGRVVEERRLLPASEADSLWRNLVNMYRRMHVHAIPRATVRARYAGASREITCDARGFFDAWLDVPHPTAEEREWHEVELELVRPSRHAREPVRALAEVLVPPSRARFAVISDIDDTVVKTGAARLLTLVRQSFLSTAYTRLPFPGVAAFYRALHAGVGGDEQNPMLYVSRSPWNLYDLLAQFFAIHAIPVGPVLYLRQWGLSAEGLTTASSTGLKYRRIGEMLATYAHLPFILIGDSGQKDPEIYHALIRDHPGRILAAYIRNVSRKPARIAAIRALAQEVARQGSTLILADDSLAMAEHAAENGWIAADRVAEVRAYREADEAAPGVKGERPVGRAVEVAPGRGGRETRAAVRSGAVEQALAQGEDREATPTVIVRGDAQRQPDA